MSPDLKMEAQCVMGGRRSVQFDICRHLHTLVFFFFVVVVVYTQENERRECKTAGDKD